MTPAAHTQWPFAAWQERGKGGGRGRGGSIPSQHCAGTTKGAVMGTQLCYGAGEEGGGHGTVSGSGLRCVGAVGATAQSAPRNPASRTPHPAAFTPHPALRFPHCMSRSPEEVQSIYYRHTEAQGRIKPAGSQLEGAPRAAPPARRRKKPSSAGPPDGAGGARRDPHRENSAARREGGGGAEGGGAEGNVSGRGDPGSPRSSGSAGAVFRRSSAGALRRGRPDPSGSASRNEHVATERRLSRCSSSCCRRRWDCSRARFSCAETA